MKNVLVKIRRGLADLRSWEEFSVRAPVGMTVAGLLKAIEARPVTREGKATTPVVWATCAQVAPCGTCTMRINGKVLAACETFVSDLSQPVVLEPLTKFNLLRDLMVDKHSGGKTVTSGKVREGFFSYQEPMLRQKNPEAYSVATNRCTECGACVEACPQYRDGASFVGPRELAKAFNNREANDQDLYLSSRGVLGCDNSQNCVRACPEKIPLTEMIGLLKRKSVAVFLKTVLG